MKSGNKLCAQDVRALLIRHRQHLDANLERRRLRIAELQSCLADSNTNSEDNGAIAQMRRGYEDPSDTWEARVKILTEELHRKRDRVAALRLTEQQLEADFRNQAYADRELIPSLSAAMRELRSIIVSDLVGKQASRKLSQSSPQPIDTQPTQQNVFPRGDAGSSTHHSTTPRGSELPGSQQSSRNWLSQAAAPKIEERGSAVNGTDSAFVTASVCPDHSGLGASSSVACSLESRRLRVSGPGARAQEEARTPPFSMAPTNSTVPSSARTCLQGQVASLLVPAGDGEIRTRQNGLVMPTRIGPAVPAVAPPKDVLRVSRSITPPPAQVQIAGVNSASSFPRRPFAWPAPSFSGPAPAYELQSLPATLQSSLRAPA